MSVKPRRCLVSKRLFSSDCWCDSEMKWFHVLLCLLFTSTTSLTASSSSSSETFSANGKVLELDESNFDEAISTFDYILVDFYAPWCGHCKRLSPELDAAAPVLANLKEPVVLAKVNADKFTRLARKYDIDGYPTLKIFIHGIPMEYSGPRKADVLVRYLKKFVAPDVSVLDSDAAINDFIESAGTYFPLYVGFGLNESVVQKLAVKYKKKASFSVAHSFSEEVMITYDFDKVPALVAVLPKYNERSIFYGPFEDAFLEDFIRQNMIPLVAPINHDTLNILKDDDRKIVLTIVDDEEKDKSKELVKLLKAAASANRDLVFAYVGFIQYAEFADNFGSNRKGELPKMVIWDGSEEYFSVTGSEVISDDNQANQISQFLEGYREGRVSLKKISGLSLIGYINSFLGFGTLYIIVVVVAILMILRIMSKDDSEHQRVPNQEDDDQSGRITQDRDDQTSSSTSETQIRGYQPGDKED